MVTRLVNPSIAIGIPKCWISTKLSFLRLEIKLSIQLHTKFCALTPGSPNCFITLVRYQNYSNEGLLYRTAFSRDITWNDASASIVITKIEWLLLLASSCSFLHLNYPRFNYPRSQFNLKVGEESASVFLSSTRLKSASVRYSRLIPLGFQRKSNNKWIRCDVTWTNFPRWWQTHLVGILRGRGSSELIIFQRCVGRRVQLHAHPLPLTVSSSYNRGYLSPCLCPNCADNLSY